MKEQKFDITGMTCSACSSHIEKAISKLEGIENVEVSLVTNTMTAKFDNDVLKEEEIISKVVSEGYGASVAGSVAKPTANNNEDDTIKNMKTRLFVSFLFLIPHFYISMGHMMGLPVPGVFHDPFVFAFTQMLLTLPVMYVNRTYFQIGFKRLFKGSPNMDTLIAVGSSAAFVYGVVVIYKIGFALSSSNMMLAKEYAMDLYFESASMILALITLGKFLEARSKGKTKEAITKLMDLAPKTAIVIRDGKEQTIGVEDIVINDIIIVKPGQSIPCDGVIIEGTSTIDESAITGESIPVEKTVGDKVVGATINKAGYLKFTAQKIGEDTTLAQIIKLVEEASSSKAPIAKLADKVSGIFVPVVITISVISTIVWLLLGHSIAFSLSIGIAVLVISCPCALGLATPVAIMVGTGVGAQNGVLIKSAQALEVAHNIDTIVLDKTGTITEGKPKVTDILCFGDYQKDDILKMAASIEKMSEHPLSLAVVEKAKEDHIDLLYVDNFEVIVGKGVKGTIDGETYFIGNSKEMLDYEIDISLAKVKADELADKGKTPLYFAKGNQVIGIIAVADVVKNTSKQAIKEFKNLGIKTVMLTGDNKKVANAIKEQVGVDEVVAELLPKDKEKKIKELQDKTCVVGMIGDGINDAPALTRADVGIAIGAGTDIAIESADIVLMKSDLLDAVTAVRLSKAVIKNIKGNLFWAFFYNTIGIPVAAGLLYPVFGLKLNPMIGAAAMSMSSVCVVLNALRLKLFKVNKFKEEGIEMEKIVKIEGMSCGHCSGRVEKALNQVDGIEATVDLQNKQAHIKLTKDISDEQIKSIVEDAGYEVVGIE